MSVTESDLSVLAASYDIITLGALADEARLAKHGRRTTFVRVAEVSAEPGHPVSVPPSSGEVRIVGTPASRIAAVTRAAEVAAASTSTPVSGYSLADLERLAALEKITLRALLEDLYAAGLELVAEAPFDRLLNPHRAIEEVNISGLALGRLTVHRWPDLETSVFLKRVAAVQYQVAVIRAFAPLPRTPNPVAPSTGYDDVKKVALARLVLEDVPTIQVDWALYGPKLAQVALTFGADDLDSVSVSEEAPEGPRRAPLEEVRRNIIAAGFEPVERDGRFEIRAR
jgi:aminodeoxyfutalosine synthase